jgi:hypothetical protein
MSEYDLDAVWKTFTKNQQAIITCWMTDPEIRFKRELAAKLEMSETHVNEILNSKKAQDYMREYALANQANEIAQVDSVTYKAAITGSDRDRRLFYERKCLLNKDAVVSVNNSGTDPVVNLTITPVYPANDSDN